MGGTMWFPPNPSNWMFERFMPDFKKIANLRDYAYRENSRLKESLRKHCEPDDIVVTHHLPLYKSVSERYMNSQINRFFVSDMSRVINKNKPTLWVHGHTHGKFDYMAGDTRVVCNPRGYPGEMSTAVWDNHLIIEL